MTKVHIEVLTAAWRHDIGDPVGTATKAAAAALAAVPQNEAEESELCIVLADDALSRRLNRAHRGCDAATNVLAFRLPRHEKGPRHLGDVVVSYDTLAREAAAADLPFAHHLAHLVVHGTLHLLGYDHQSSRQAQRMERLETEILGGLGIEDPYGDHSASLEAEVLHG